MRKTTYHLFAWDLYYPEGGLGDYVGSFSTLENARYNARRVKKDRWQIMGTTEGRLDIYAVESGART